MPKVLFRGSLEYKGVSEPQEKVEIVLDLDFRPIVDDTIVVELKHSFVSFKVTSTTFNSKGALEVTGDFIYRRHKKD